MPDTKSAAQLTPEDIQAVIVGEAYFTAADALAKGNGADVFQPHSPFSLLTFCVLVLRNGFTVTGESTCASPDHFDPAKGREVARANAISKIWALEGYLLKQRLWEQALHAKSRAAADDAHIGNDLIYDAVFHKGS